MEAITERVREALHVGGFEPTSLEAEDRMLADAAAFADYARRLERAARQFGRDCAGFASSITRDFLTAAPYPRLWAQATPYAAAEPRHCPVPEPYAALFTAELHARLAESVPPTIAAAVDADLAQPLAAWLAAYDDAKDRLPRLHRLRLEYDAARRRLGAAEGAAAGAALAPLTTGGGGVGGVTGHVSGGAASVAAAARAERQLGRREGEFEPVLARFEAERALTSGRLEWLAAAACNLKAYAADVARALRDAAVDYHVPEGLLLPCPESAAGAAAGAPPQQHTEGQEGGEGEAIVARGPVPTALTAPPPEGARVRPEGAGIGGLLVDTAKSAIGLPTGAPLGARAAGHEASAAPAAVAPPPPPHAAHAAPTPFAVAAARDEAAAAAAATESQPAAGVATNQEPDAAPAAGAAVAPLGVKKEEAAEGGHPSERPLAGGLEPPCDTDDRAPRPYGFSSAALPTIAAPPTPERVLGGGGGGPQSPGRGMRECRMPDEAARGLGQRGRQLSEGLPATVAGGGDAGEGEAEPRAGPDWPVMPKPELGPAAARTAPAAAAAPAGGDEDAPATPAAAAGGDAKTGGGGGLLGAIKAAVAPGKGGEEAPPSEEQQQEQAPSEGGGLLPAFPQLGAVE